MADTEPPEALDRDPGRYLASLDRYDDVALVARGGMGAVYRAFDRRLDRVVALKVVQTALASDRAVKSRFRREVAVLARLDHPNLVRIFEADATGPFPYFSMEFVDGRGWLDHLHQVQSGPGAVVELFLPLLDAVAALHEAGVLHRDIKPGNVMVTSDGIPKLMDLGLAMLDRSTVTRISRTGELLGTLGSIPPEVMTGGTYERRGDVYQLGLLLYRSLSGRSPVSSADCLALLEERRPLPRPSLADVPIDGPLAAIVERAAAPMPTDRFATVPEFADALRQWQRGELTHIISKVTDRPAASTLRRTAIMLFGAAVLAATVLIVHRHAASTAAPVFAFDAPRLEALDRLVLPYRGPPSGACRLAFHGDGGRVDQLTVDLATARTVGPARAVLVVDLPFAVLAPTRVTVTDPDGTVHPWPLDPGPTLERLLAPCDALAAETALGRAIGACVSHYRQPDDDVAPPAQPTEPPTLLADLGLDGEASAALRRLLPKILPGELPTGLLARRVEPLRPFESVMPHPPPWGAVSPLLGITVHAATDRRTPPGYVEGAAASLVGLVDGKELWTWLGSRLLDMRSRQPALTGVLYVTSHMGMQGFPSFDPRREVVPLPADVKPERSARLDLPESLPCPWPPRRAILAIDVRTMTRYTHLFARVNGNDPVSIVNSVRSSDPVPVRSFTDHLTFHVPIDPSWLRRHGNRVTFTMRPYPGTTPMKFLSMSGVRLYLQ